MIRLKLRCSGVKDKREDVAKQVRGGSKIYNTIREAILRLEMRPGSVIDEAELANRIKVSRTPVREAIIQLIADDLVIRDGRSARVAPLDFDEVPKLYDALLVSSRMIHRLAAQNRTSEDLRNIRAAMVAFENGIESGDGLTRSELNVDFHLKISAAAHNAYFESFYEKILLATIRLARACFSSLERTEFVAAHPEEDIAAHLAETVRHHKLMYKAIQARDVEASDRLAVMHQDLSKNRLQRALFQTATALGAVALN
ncbi:GntR family transcriptional regulator [Bradyrhizobium canariense]|uniref:GntR family transcriptional regulator n=1 Tax=Bradyrhizobium canariense TaxID=255045 RepID=UPI001C66B969|nr:GntR family transcriptional regulator [Bradyrhizobium canariense]MBW5434065.1 GntR family transcriptional regulator [Bradyrhizobium canariense]